MKLLIAGDICPQYRVANLMEQGCYDDIVGKVKAIIGKSDYSLVNLECPIVKDECTPIQKCGPNLKTTKKCIELIKYAGFKGVTLANNHFLDYGEDGIFHTLTALDEAGVTHVGGGKNLVEASRIMYINGDDEKVAIINCCEHEFSIATECSAGSNPLNPICQWHDIQEAKTKADYVILIVHGGHEYYQLPSIRMQDTYRFFIEAGADAIVNHHQHCYSGYEIYKGKPIVYGLGNFCFDEDGCRNSSWNEGYMTMLTIKGGDVGLTVYPYMQCNENPTVMPLSDSIYFERTLTKLNKIIMNSIELKKCYQEYVEKSFEDYRLEFSPYNNRFLRKLCHCRILPAFIFKEKILRMFNLINCESHRDKLLEYLNNHSNLQH